MIATPLHAIMKVHTTPPRSFRCRGLGRNLLRRSDVPKGIPHPDPFCSIGGCDKPTYGHGFCRRHWYCWRTNGDPLTLKTGRGLSPAERLVRQSERWGECLLWTGTLDSSGYGMLRIDGHHRKTHIVAYELEHGPVPTGLTLDHLCHNRDPECLGGLTCPHRRCMEASHLEAVSRGVNINRSQRSNAAKTHCKCGLPLSGDNLLTRPDRPTSRECQACSRRRRRECDARQRSS